MSYVSKVMGVFSKKKSPRGDTHKIGIQRSNQRPLVIINTAVYTGMLYTLASYLDSEIPLSIHC